MLAAFVKVPAGVLPNVKLICAEVVASQSVRNVWGYASFPDHNNRRCIDYMMVSIAAGDAIAAYNWKHRKRLGLVLQIWNRKIQRTYDKPGIPAGTWARYTGPKPHTDHVHAEYASKAYVPPIGAPAPSAPPKPPTTPVVLPDTLRDVVVVMANFQWSGFSKSPKDPDGKRTKAIVKAIKAQGPSIVIAQELSRLSAGIAAAAMGQNWHYQRAAGNTKGQGLNVVMWDNDIWDQEGDSREFNLRSWGQMTRTLLIVKLRHRKTGQYVWAASSHLANAGGTDFRGITGPAAQVDQAKQIAFITDDYEQIMLGLDANDKTDGDGPRAVLIKSGLIPETKQVKVANLAADSKRGIDTLMTKKRVLITSAKVFSLDDNSDHDGRRYTVDIYSTTPKKS